ncbi:MAG: hypothetical protein LBM77_04250 [Spirochaetaceae bacterium]|jgi:hypothetical protein|nr:hypothetical protein [Spirochaetaceae bacterium]
MQWKYRGMKCAVLVCLITALSGLCLFPLSLLADISEICEVIDCVHDDGSAPLDTPLPHQQELPILSAKSDSQPSAHAELNLNRLEGMMVPCAVHKSNKESIFVHQNFAITASSNNIIPLQFRI